MSRKTSMGWNDFIHMPTHIFLALGNILSNQLKKEDEAEKEQSKTYSQSYSNNIPNMNIPDLSNIKSQLGL